MKETNIVIASQTQQLATDLLPEQTSDQHILMRALLWIWRCLLLQNTDHPTLSQMSKHMRPQWIFVNVAFCLILVGPCLLTPFIGQQTAWAAAAHQAHLDRTDAPNANIFTQIGHIIKDIGLIIASVFSKDLLGWVSCLATAGIVECPNAVHTKWGFECSASPVAWCRLHSQHLRTQLVHSQHLRTQLVAMAQLTNKL